MVRCAPNNLLKAAKRDGFIKILPTVGVERFKTDQKKRRFYTFAEIETVCTAALTASKNGRQLGDYILFLASRSALRHVSRAPSRASPSAVIVLSKSESDRFTVDQ